MRALRVQTGTHVPEHPHPAKLGDVNPLPGGEGVRTVLFVFNWLVVGGEETEVRLLARHLDPSRYRIEVVACFRKPNMPEQTHTQFEQLGIPVDRTPYSLSFEDTVDYLARKVAAYDLVVACQAPPDLYPALERLHPTQPHGADRPPLPPRSRGGRGGQRGQGGGSAPPLIEHGGLVSEATAGPKHLTARYVGVCAAIRDAAAVAMPDRPHHALEVPSMVDLGEFDPADRRAARREWGLDEAMPAIGWVGRLDRKKRVEDVIRAARLVHESHPETRFLLIGGPDAFMPEYADELRGLARALGLEGVVRFLGDRPDVPRLLMGLDVFVWLSRGEGMPHVIAEAGAACLPVVATRDGGTEQQIVDGVSGLFVPHERPEAVAAALDRLIGDADLRRRLGANLRQKVEREYSAEVVTRRWQALFDEVIAEGPR